MRRAIAVTCVLAAAVFAACQVEPPDCPQSIAEDVFTISAIHVFNGTLGQNGSGSNYTCNGGGSAHISGTVTNMGSNADSQDLTFQFTNCHDTDLVLDDLTLNGTFHYTGTFANSGNGFYCTNCTGDASALSLNGSMFLCHADHVDATCAIQFTLTNSSSSAFFDNSTGSVCGLTFP